MTEETATIQRLDYSKPPPGYTVRFEDSSGANGDGPPLWWYGAPHCLASMGSEAEALAAAWAHYKAHNDPPGMWSGQARGEHPGGYGYALMESSHEHPLEADFERIDDARAAAWAWYDRRLALTSRLDTAPGFRVDHCGDCGAENEPSDRDRCTVCQRRGTIISTWGRAQAERYKSHERYTTAAGQRDQDVGPDIWPQSLTWSDAQVVEVERWLVDSTAEMPEVLRG